MRAFLHTLSRRALPFVALVGISAGAAQAQFFSANDLFPSNNAVYSLDPGESMHYANGYSIDNLSFFGFDNAISLPGLVGNSSDVTFHFNINLGLNNGSSLTQYSGTGTGSFHITFDSNNSGVRSYSISLTQFDVSFGSTPFLIRQSGDFASTGTHVVTAVTGGYWIEGHLDLNTDLSLNGGSSWSAQTNRNAHDVLSVTPEPFTMSLGIAGVGLFVRRKIKRKAA